GLERHPHAQKSNGVRHADFRDTVGPDHGRALVRPRPGGGCSSAPMGVRAFIDMARHRTSPVLAATELPGSLSPQLLAPAFCRPQPAVQVETLLLLPIGG